MAENTIMAKRADILKSLENNRDTIKTFGVKRLGLFGSCAREEQTASSDLDFIVEFETNTFDAYMDLKAFLEKLFSRSVDLVLADSIKPRLRESILREVIDAPGL